MFVCVCACGFFFAFMPFVKNSQWAVVAVCLGGTGISANVARRWWDENDNVDVYWQTQTIQDAYACKRSMAKDDGYVNIQMVCSWIFRLYVNAFCSDIWRLYTAGNITSSSHWRILLLCTMAVSVWNVCVCVCSVFKVQVILFTLGI